MKSIFTAPGIRELDFDLDDHSVDHLNTQWKKFAHESHQYPEGKFAGKGIVFCAGGLSYFTCAWVSIQNLNYLGCKLPIELWYQDSELPSGTIGMLESIGVMCKNFLDYTRTNLEGAMLKPLAIKLSQFEEVLFIDADNVSLKDPSYLFDSTNYKAKGTIFWPDYWKTSGENPIWKIVESENYNSPEQESGQLLVNKRKCWKELMLCLYFNENNRIYHRLLYGDKDTFKFAWIALKTEYFMVEEQIGCCGYMSDSNEFIGNTMVQHDDDGQIIFLHRNLLKWNTRLTNLKAWQRIKKFRPESLNKIIKIKGTSLDLAGNISDVAVPESVEDLETRCYNVLEELNVTHFYEQFVRL